MLKKLNKKCPSLQFQTSRQKSKTEVSFKYMYYGLGLKIDMCAVLQLKTKTIQLNVRGELCQKDKKGSRGARKRRII